MKIIGLIPIRSGSKRFPDKNVFRIKGIPLFIFSAEIAKQSGIFERIIISSDSQDYLDIAKKFGYDTHLRSKHTSHDSSTSEQVISEVISSERLLDEDWIFLIQATNPFQKHKYFQDAKKAINSEISSVITYRPFTRFFLEDVINKSRPRTQDMKPKELETGLFWGMNVQKFNVFKQRIIEPYAKISIREADDVDIDYYEDLECHIHRLEMIADKIDGKIK